LVCCFGAYVFQATILVRFKFLKFAHLSLKTSHYLPFPGGPRDGNRLALYGLSDRWKLLGLKVIIYDVQRRFAVVTDFRQVRVLLTITSFVRRNRRAHEASPVNGSGWSGVKFRLYPSGRLHSADRLRHFCQWWAAWTENWTKRTKTRRVEGKRTRKSRSSYRRTSRHTGPPTDSFCWVIFSFLWWFMIAVRVYRCVSQKNLVTFCTAVAIDVLRWLNGVVLFLISGIYWNFWILSIGCRILGEHVSRCYSPDGWVNPSEIGYSPDNRADLPELGYSPDGPVTKLIKPKCPNTSHMYNTIAYNILLLQSQTDRCESDKYNDM